MNYFIDFACNSLNKSGEELCGDKVELITTKDSIIIVMADGLGSGVKANILSTLTSKIAATMLKEGASIYETVDTIVHTLPVCNIRKIAYSTFTILKVYYDGRVYVAEYDNPPFFLISKRGTCVMDRTEVKVNEKVVKETEFIMEDGDVLTVVSDGAIHAGVGAVLNLGWQWENVEDYLKRIVLRQKCAKNISLDLIKACQCLYDYRPGDDTTVVTVKIRKPEVIDLFTGPPQDPGSDKWVIKNLIESKGKKIICGGTAANIAARELGEEVVVNMEVIDPEIPPTAEIKGVDLVTEGVITLNKAIEKIRDYMNPDLEEKSACQLNGRDGASQLARMLIEDCTHLNLWVGRAINPAHQNAEFPLDLSKKIKLVDELRVLMEGLGRIVRITYV